MQARDAAQPQNLDALGDAELVQLARERNGDAFRIIMQRNNQRLYRVARSVVQDDSEAEDVVQEAYVRAFGSLGQFRGDSSLAILAHPHHPASTRRLDACDDSGTWSTWRCLMRSPLAKPRSFHFR